jgi:outer membrane receptor protein involved in Fe transport
VELTPAQISALNGRNLGVALSANDLLALDPRILDYSVELQPKTFGTTQTLLAMYIEDEWQLSPRLTATLGLRWDYDSLSAKGGRGGDFDNFALASPSITGPTRDHRSGSAQAFSMAKSLTP